MNFQTTPTLVADAIGRHIDEVLRDAIRKRLEDVAAEVVEAAVRDIAGQVVGRIESYSNYGGGVTIQMAINGIVLPEAKKK